MSNPEKNYINGIIIKEKVFDNGGSILKVSIKTEEFQDQVNAITEKGWANLVLAKRKQKSETGITHYCYVDDFKPTVQNSYIKQNSTKEDDNPF